jgi:hypothetical protein
MEAKRLTAFPKNFLTDETIFNVAKVTAEYVKIS